MVNYIETSILLSILLGDSFHGKAIQIWNSPGEKVSSVLAYIESLIVIRRFFKKNKKTLPPKWLSIQEKQLKDLLSECFLMKVDESIQSIVDLKKEISDCRSLDGIHIATAIFLKEHFRKSDFCFFSFDNRLNEVAGKLGFNPLIV